MSKVKVKTLVEITNQLVEVQGNFDVELKKQLEGNKAAGRRARLLSLDLTKLHLEFRKISVNN